MQSQQDPPNDYTPDGPSAKTPAHKVTATNTVEDRHMCRGEAISGNEGVNLDFGANESTALDIAKLATMLTDQFMNETKKKANSIKKAKTPAHKLLDGVPHEYVDLCWKYLESYAKMNDVDVDAVVDHFKSAEDLVNHAKQHEVAKERRLRPAITLTQKFQESLASHRKDDTHLRPAITTTQKVKVSKWFDCRIVNRPEGWLRLHEILGAWKGVYFSAWVRDNDLHYHHVMRALRSEEYQSLSRRQKTIFSRIIDDAFRYDSVDSKKLYLRLKVGSILDEYLYLRIKNLHQSEGKYARMRFISTYDLCDDKVTELEDLLKYTCSRFTRMSLAGMVSCIAGVNSEVFYTTLHNIDEILVKAAEEFVKKGTFTATFTQLDESGDVETVTIKETDRNENSPQYRYYYEFCLKSDRKYHKNDCVYKRDEGDVRWQEFSQSLKIHCKCSPFYEEPDYVSDMDEEWLPVDVDWGSGNKRRKKCREKRRKIVIDTNNTELSNEQMKAMLRDTSDIVLDDEPGLADWPREDAEEEDPEYARLSRVLNTLPMERLLARPCLGDDGGLAPELLELWGRNTVKISGKPGTQLPFRMRGAKGEEQRGAAAEELMEEEAEGVERARSVAERDSIDGHDLQRDEDIEFGGGGQDVDFENDVETPFNVQDDFGHAEFKNDDLEDGELSHQSDRSSFSLGAVNEMKSRSADEDDKEEMASSNKKRDSQKQPTTPTGIKSPTTTTISSANSRGSPPNNRCCTYPGCTRALFARGKCHKHDNEVNSVDKKKSSPPNNRCCTYPGCTRALFARGKCYKHDTEVRRQKKHDTGRM